jgi:hypothetical protein
MLPSNNKTNWLKNAITVFTVIFVIAFLFGFSNSVYAADGDIFEGPQEQTDLFGLEHVDQSIGLSGEDIRLIIARIIRAVLGLLGMIALSIVLYAGYMIMTSGGQEEKILYGKKILINGVIGLTIILSAFIIVSFVINSLADIYGINRDGQPSRTPIINTFTGSGALGEVVKDHYPFVDQEDVARNTSIVVTFAEPLKPESLIINSNNTCWPLDGSITPIKIEEDGEGCLLDAEDEIVEYYGDCLTADGELFNQETDCDLLATSSVQIYKTEDKDLEEILFVESTALASYEDGAAKNLYTLVFKPFEYLDTDSYTVYLSDEIKKKPAIRAEDISIFDGHRENFYDWQFETGDDIDFTPPHVESHFPSDKKSGYRNSILQIYFSEPVDPTVTQGYFSSSSIFNNLVVDSSSTLDIKGEWKLSNGYTVAEFVPEDECGLNTCGDIMFCLPVDCTDCEEKYEILVRTAELLGNDPDVPFAAELFTGVYDLAGNALNGDEIEEGVERVAEGQPGGDPENFIRDEDRIRDNDWWNFDISSRIDRSAPYIEYITPGIDEEDVKGFANVDIRFNEVMWARTLRDFVKLDEYKENHCYDIDGRTVCLSNLWQAVRSNLVDASGQKAADGEKTLVSIIHREFGPNNTDLYYFPKVFSQVKDANQNCFYPGRGPKVDPSSGNTTECHVNYNEDGIFQDQTDCIEMENASSTADTACITTYPTLPLSKVVGSIEPECMGIVKTEEVSPMNQNVE